MLPARALPSPRTHWRNRRSVRRSASGRSVYNYNRDYDPAVGRYVESDPIGLNGGSYSTYSYANGNPLGNIDFDGLQIAAGAEVGAEVGTAIEPGVGTAVGAGIGAAIGTGVVAYEMCKDKKCPPCKTVSGKVVPVGTISYRPLDVIPDDVQQHGVYGSHHNLFQANQYPYPKCDCFWRKLKNVAKPSEIQPGWIPIEPFAN